MYSPLLITGGTGLLGRLVVPRLRDSGRDLRVLSRRSHESEPGIDFVVGDLASGEGLERAVAGVETIVHLGGSAKGDDRKALNLVRAASRADVRYIVNMSVVGAERIPVSGFDRVMFGYFAAKRDAEEIIAGSGVPWTTLRATQFHQAMLKIMRSMTKMPVVAVPSGFNFQPVDAEEVAGRLVQLALGSPAGLAPDFAGPEVHSMAGLVRSYLRIADKHRPVLQIPFPGTAANAIRAGANLAPERAVGRRTWEEFLVDELGRDLSPEEREERSRQAA